MAALTTIALVAGAAAAVGSAAHSAYGAKRQRDAEEKAEDEQKVAKQQMESDLYNKNSGQAMRLLRQRILAGRGKASAGAQGGQLGTQGASVGGYAPAPKTALGA
jgi:hypothetical protein